MMKHSLKITLILLVLFLVSQFMGIFIVNQYIDVEESIVKKEVTFKELPYGERPPKEDNWSFLPIILALFMGTGLAFVLLKYKLMWVWKIWFVLAIGLALMIAFGAFFSAAVSLVLGFIFSVWKVFKPNIVIHNIGELLVYGGLAVLFVPMLTLFSVSVLFILIALYDAYAVWKSKHMVTLAQEQQKARLFAGFLIPYSWKNDVFTRVAQKSNFVSSSQNVRVGDGHTRTSRVALLGGGDVAFPILFAGVVLKVFGLFSALVIPVFAVMGLAFLMWWGEEKKFYPAMPFIAVGCFVGLLIVWSLPVFLS